MRRLIAFLLLSGSLAACSHIRELGCPTGLHRAESAQLFFGRNIGSAEGVSDADWQSFVDQEVTPRFPDGLSVTDADGQWKGANGQIVRERSKALMIVLSGGVSESAKLGAIRNAYKQRFQQEAVMLVITDACVGF